MLQNLRKLRTERGISQSRLGQEIGVSQQAINKYENHNIEPDIYTLKLLADFFDTSIDYLVGRIDVRNGGITPISGKSNGEFASLSKREFDLIQSFRRINNLQKESIELVMKSYLEKPSWAQEKSR